MTSLRQLLAIVAITLKQRLAFSWWFWTDIIGQIVVMVIYTCFLRAVYANSASINGVSMNQAVSFALIANAVGMVVRWTMIWELGAMLRDGSIAVELTRPLDFQLRMAGWMIATVSGTMLQHMLLLGTFACLFLGLRLPSDPLVWLCFIASLALGNAIFFFDWTLSLVAFASTEVRGLANMRDGLAAFFSGFIIPLAMMPQWLQRIAAAIPFGQILNTPVQILAGITPLAAAPRALLIQLVWLIALAVVSRPAFALAARRVTVQGG